MGIDLRRGAHILAALAWAAPCQSTVSGWALSPANRWPTAGMAYHNSPRVGLWRANSPWLMPTSQISLLSQPSGASSMRTSEPIRLMASIRSGKRAWATGALARCTSWGRRYDQEAQLYLLPHEERLAKAHVAHDPFHLRFEANSRTGAEISVERVPAG